MLKLYDQPSAPLELKLRVLRAEVLEKMLYGCEMLRRAHHSFLTHCISRQEDNCTDLPISYLDTLMNTGSEIVDAIMRGRRMILFAGYGARIEGTRLPNYVMSGRVMGRAGYVRGQEKGWMACLLDDLRAFAINADQWTTVAQDEGGWRKTEEQGAERFMVS